MATALDRIIDGASDPSVSTSDLLRRTLAAAHRVRADEVKGWAERELSGYDGIEEEELPTYRRGLDTAVKANWAGPFNSSVTTSLTPLDKPDDWFSPWFRVVFRQPVSELESYADVAGELGLPWPVVALSRWNEMIDAGRAVHVDGMRLYTAETKVAKQAVVGVLDAVRTEVMKFALDLQSAADTAGEPGGPTVEDNPKVEGAVTNFYMNVYGGAPTIAQGASVTQTVTVNVGDIGSLARAAESLGLAGGDVTEYVEAVLEARNDPDKSKLREFAERVGRGVVTVGNGIVGNIAATKLLEWGTTFLGG
ncbi:hypothetical protein ASE27_10220 [Oerskovia sp. Root918]|uniref:AbiTii domain-containing protein n=1 Tax=Oerskovia sp. Root918 TaxID=1736607 RepID=UPI0006F4289D|nr:hypothetical protein [Oerskovia sp. Root918]KRD36822.1 hypothetical protein ASE27_10220 [Oerskovia sp. Root918]